MPTIPLSQSLNNIPNVSSLLGSENFVLVQADIGKKATKAMVETMLGLAGSNTGDQTITLTGDVTGSGTGSFAATVDNDKITFAKMQNIATDRLLGRDTAATGDPEELTIGGGIEFTGSGGIQRSALTGDVTASAGSNALTVVIAPLPRSYLAGLGLANNATDPTNDIDINVGTCRDSTDAQNITLASALVKRLDAAWVVGTDQGGLDTGSIANTTYHVWAIKRSDTGVCDVLFSTSSSAPTMPTNYDYKRRIGSILRVSSAIVLFTQMGDTFLRLSPSLDVNVTNLGTAATLYTLTVPLGIKVSAIINSMRSYNASAGVNTRVTSPDQADEAVTSFNASYATGGAAVWEVASGVYRTNTSAQIRARADQTSTNFQVNTSGWIDGRGRDD